MTERLITVLSLGVGIQSSTVLMLANRGTGKGGPMIQQPNLDRFSQPGSYEKRYGVKVLLLMPECHICGQKAHPEFLRRWNGITACKYCITDINEEAEKV